MRGVLQLLTLFTTLGLGSAAAQQPPSPVTSGEASRPPATLLNPLGAPASPFAQPSLSPGILLLYDLERRFAEAVASGGGKAFSAWFADDAVALNNGRPAVLGRGNIAASATWDPKTYQLSWIPQGAQMLPSNDSGFTWGHYEGRATDQHGQPVLTSGRYITLWKKVSDGSWKVVMDASSNEPPDAGACCVLPKP